MAVTTEKPDLIELARLNAAQGPRTPVLTEYVGVGLFFSLIAAVVARSLPIWREAGLAGLALAALLGYVAADVVSGLVHWAFDTWGSPDTPVVGKNFIVPFRIHHVDPEDITRHGFVATNGHNCLAASLGLLAALALPARPLWSLAAMFLLSLCVSTFGTNQFHKWAHMAAEVGPVVRLLQRTGLILGVDHHQVHHDAPFADHYCITSGWMNGPLRGVRFFRALEWMISRASGAEPRRDDLIKAAKGMRG